MGDIDEAVAAAVCTLPSLTALNAHRCRSVAFLPGLPLLRTLALHMDMFVSLAADVVPALSRCTQLTDLLSAEDMTSAHMSQILPHLPLLRTLGFFEFPALVSLSFLSDCAHLVQSLMSLDLISMEPPVMHSTELKHVLALKSLTSLELSGWFVEPLDACTQHLFTPPTAALPMLNKFAYTHSSYGQ